MEIIKTVKKWFADWKEKRFLKKHGCKTREEYERRYDPDVNYRGDTLEQFYHGYSKVHSFDDHNHFVYFWDLGCDGSYVMNKWCRENCRDKFRMDYLRGFKNPYGNWILNGIGDTDFITIAFKDERDFTWFMLKWS